MMIFTRNILIAVLLMSLAICFAQAEKIQDCFLVTDEDKGLDPPGADGRRVHNFYQSTGNHGYFTSDDPTGVSIQPWDKNIIVVRTGSRDTTEMNWLLVVIKRQSSLGTTAFPWFYLKGPGKCLIRNADYLEFSYGMVYNVNKWKH